MKIQYLGHSSFLLTTAAGTRIVTDPVDSDGYPGSLTYRAFDEFADIVTISHDHADSSGLSVIKGAPIVIKGNGKFVAKEVEFRGVETFHDGSRGAQRGRNIVFVISADGLNVAHLGDLGHVLTADQAAEIGAVDVALVPVGGYFTLDAGQADKVAEQIEAKIIVPMHYKTEKCSFPMGGIEAFVEGKPNVTRQAGSVLELTRESLPDRPQIVILKYAL